MSTVPLAVAAALPRGRYQYAATWGAYVWLFKVAWEIPYDKPEKLAPRLRIDYPIRLDSRLGAGVPPGSASNARSGSNRGSLSSTSH